MPDPPKPPETASFPVNPDLVWDYEIPTEQERTEAFNRWYLARVLTRGNSNDLKSIGLRTIYQYFPTLNLPSEIHRFWHWYFNLPEVKKRYGHSHTISTPANLGD